jgi:hypothetical protein
VGDLSTYALVIGDGQIAMTNEYGHDLTIFHQENMKICFVISSAGLSQDLPSVKCFLCDCPDEACSRQLYIRDVQI